ncbi:MAG: hypothetical protein QOI66_1272 [Myxococcales bacterium]|jgi:hypothetical protein|nr:hypothetical protein [Myxococcales bacterium]
MSIKRLLIESLTVALGAALVVGCSGQIGSANGGPGGVTGGGPPNGGPPSGGGGGGATSGAGLLDLPSSPLPTNGLHKLTAWEFANSLQDLLGGSGVPLSPVEVDTLIGGFATVGGSTVAISPAGVGQYETVLGVATTFAFGDATRAKAVLPCVPQSAADAACLTSALNTFGRRAFRRPLSADETTAFVTLATTVGSQAGSNVLSGIQHAVWAMLQSPDFLYRVELGTPSAADGGRLKYTSFEIASRLAAVIWGSVPDDPLLDAAAGNALATSDGIRTQVQRMVADPRAHRALAAFSDQLFDAFALGQADKDPTLFPAYTATLRAAMLKEIELRVDDMTFTQKGDFLSLFEGTTTFVNKELAAFYGVPFTATDGDFHRVDLGGGSPRVGLLGAAGILAGHAHSELTSPTARGKFVDTMLLCRTVPEPPPGVPPLPSHAPPGSTVRQIMEAHRSQPQCAGCHALMDPIGFAMENFDASGQYRTSDNGQPIDASGELDGVAFNSLAGLGSALRKNAATGPCLVSKVYESALGRLPIAVDAAALDQLITKFNGSGHHIDQLLVDLSGSDGFRFISPK